ncbi:MAG: thioredoxin [Defluviitaleaceae bacterium]|nr:thioredoxin [Defluviitaleaceae bacterium]
MLRLIGEAEFEREVLGSQKLVVVDFFATWCAPCKVLAPILDELSGELGDSASIVKMDVDQCKSIAKAYGVRGVPILVFFKDGEVVDKIAGVAPKADIAARIAPWV